MCTIWAKYLLPKALKSCPKCYRSPNLVTLYARRFTYNTPLYLSIRKLIMANLQLRKYFLHLVDILSKHLLCRYLCLISSGVFLLKWFKWLNVAAFFKWEWSFKCLAGSCHQLKCLTGICHHLAGLKNVRLAVNRRPHPEHNVGKKGFIFCQKRFFCYLIFSWWHLNRRLKLFYNKST